MVKAVFFDLDGTLLDRDTSVKRFVEAQYDRLASRLGNISKADYVARFIALDCRDHVWKDKVTVKMRLIPCLGIAFSKGLKTSKARQRSQPETFSVRCVGGCYGFIRYHLTSYDQLTHRRNLVNVIETSDYRISKLLQVACL